LKIPFVLQVAITALAASAVYFNTLFNFFVYDDLYQVVNNPWLRDPSAIGEIFTTGAWGFNETETNYYRPMMHLIYMLTYAVFKLEPWGYHLVNIVFHTLNSILVLLVAAGIMKKADHDLTGPRAYVPFLAALIFAVHPIHTEAVAWIGGIPDLSFSFFSLLALYLYMQAGNQKGSSEPKLMVASAGSFFVATLCKEPAVTLVVLLLLYDWLFNRSEMGISFFARRYSLFFLMLFVYFVLRWNALDGFSPVNKHADLNLFQSLLNIFPLFAKYVGLLLLPVNLNAWHAFHPLHSIQDPRFLLSLAVAAVFLGACLYASRTNKLLFFSLCFFLVPLLPALYIPGTGENPFAERYLYLPSFGFVLILSLLLGKIAAIPPYGKKFVLFCLIPALCILYGWQTICRNFDWKDELTFWTDTAAKSTAEPLPRYNLGAALEREGRLGEAMEQYRTALSLKPASIGHKALGRLYYRKGLKNETIQEYARALAIDPANSELHNEIGIVLLETGNHRKAVEHFQKAVKLVPDNPELRYNLAMALRKNNRIPEAIDHLRIAVQLDPLDPVFTNALQRFSDEIK